MKLPGLINAHDHLEFALFPKLGTRLYGNATEWANDVYRPNEHPVKQHRAVPKASRLIWGGIRNLLACVTTVSHHNPFDEATFSDNFPVRVIRDFTWAHSLAFEPDIQARYQPGKPFIIHAAEGTDAAARAEIPRLRELGLLTPDTILVHAIAAHDTTCPIVFCPSSNLATYGQTLTLETLRSGIPIALGSDSPITHEGDLRDDIRAAHRLGLTPDEIYAMVTTTPAKILRLPDRSATDYIVVRDDCRSLLNLQPELVVIDGRIKLSATPHADLEPIRLEGQPLVYIDAPVSKLLTEARHYLGPDIRLGGRLVTQ